MLKAHNRLAHVLTSSFQPSSYTIFFQQLEYLFIEYHINLKIANIVSALSIPLSLPICSLPCMLIILLILSGCQTPICSLFRLFALHSVAAVSALQLLKSETLSLQFFKYVPAPTLFVVISRLAICSRPSSPFNTLFLRLVFGLC